ncbi:MAG: hypothetical protein DHS20C10_03740 [marine bacterium B5-7]|nr:MAG: hypothetical protein DHS20C10_03740 [marine bacterium B5-7]
MPNETRTVYAVTKESRIPVIIERPRHLTAWRGLSEPSLAPEPTQKMFKNIFASASAEPKAAAVYATLSGAIAHNRQYNPPEKSTLTTSMIYEVRIDDQHGDVGQLEQFQGDSRRYNTKTTRFQKDDFFQKFASAFVTRATTMYVGMQPLEEAQLKWVDINEAFSELIGQAPTVSDTTYQPHTLFDSLACSLRPQASRAISQEHRLQHPTYRDTSHQRDNFLIDLGLPMLPAIFAAAVVTQCPEDMASSAPLVFLLAFVISFDYLMQHFSDKAHKQLEKDVNTEIARRPGP